MLSSLACLIALLLVAPLQAQDCNICGDGNSIQDPQGVVTFMYQGSQVRNSCLELQETVKKVSAISDEFCRTELVQYTIERCRCTTPEGDLVADLTEPTTAPSPSSVFVKAPTADGTTNVENNNKTDSNVVNKCEQAGDSAGDCDDSEEQDTSSAQHNHYVRFIGAFAFVTSLFILC